MSMAKPGTSIMNAAEFSRRRGRIESRNRLSPRRARTEMSHLVRDARAIIVVIRRRVVGYRMQSGEFVCVKHRFRDEAHAVAAIDVIRATNTMCHRAPTRAYLCNWCNGWHLTSQDRR